MEQQTSYQAGWDHLKGQYRLLWIILLTYLPGGAAIGYPLSRLLHSDIPVYLAWSCWAVGFVVVANRVQGFLCPRCGLRFFEINWFLTGIVKWCSHCRLPKWSEEPESKAW